MSKVAERINVLKTRLLFSWLCTQLFNQFKFGFILTQFIFSDAGLFVWGSNAFGQLGIEKLGGHMTTPAKSQVFTIV